MTRSGDVVWRKINLKNFFDAKPAGGCGIAPFLSVGVYFFRAVDALAQHCGHDPIECKHQ